MIVLTQCRTSMIIPIAEEIAESLGVLELSLHSGFVCPAGIELADRGDLVVDGLLRSDGYETLTSFLGFGETQACDGRLGPGASRDQNRFRKAFGSTYYAKYHVQK